MPKKRRANAIRIEERQLDIVEAKRVRKLSATPSGTAETGKWKNQAERAREALAKAASLPSRSTKRLWKIGKSPSSGGHW